MLRLFEKKAFGGCESQIFVIGDNNAGRGETVTEAGRNCVRRGDEFDWLGGYSAN